MRRVLLILLLAALPASAQFAPVGNAGGSSGPVVGENGGTVTSVAASVPDILTLTGSPITEDGTLAFGLSDQDANKFWAGPTNGAAAEPTFRLLVAADLPASYTAPLATALATARTINGTSFDGTANVTVTAAAGTLTGTTLNSTVTASSLTSFGASPTLTTPTIASFANAGHGHTNSAGGGTLAEGAIAFTDVTTGNATASAHGFLPKLSGSSSDVLKGDGTFGAAGGASLPVSDATSVVEGSSDPSKELRFEVDGFTTATTRVATFPNANITVARTDAAQTFTGTQTVAGDITNVGYSLYSNNLQANGLTLYTGYYNLIVGGANTKAKSDYVIGFAAGAADGSLDTAFSRVSAGVLGVGTGAAASVAGSIRSTYNEIVIGANVASATTITPTSGLFHVTGSAAISTINLPRSGYTGCLKLIPDGIFTLTTGGNIAIAATAVVNRVMDVCYDGTSWYPSYL